MLTASLLVLALAATGFAQAPAGYKTVYITTNVNTKFAVVPKSAKSGSAIVVNSLDNKADQQWYLKEGDSKIQLAATTLCLDAGAKSNWKSMGAITLADCSDSSDGQKWDVMTDGRIGLKASTPELCIDLQYMRATANNPVGLFACAGLGNAGAGDKGINWPLVNAAA